MPSVFPSTSEVVRSVLTTLLVGGIIALLSFATGMLDANVPLWLLIAAAVLVPVAFLAGQISQAGENLEPFYVDHVNEVLDTLQKIAAGDIPDVSSADFIERGILVPARQWLVTTKRSDEEVRLSVLSPQGSNFTMLFEAGHSVEARQKFELPTTGSFAGHALTSGEMQWTNDVESDPRWTPHPKARPGREYGSLACVPIHVGNEIVGVLSVVATDKDAFLPSELMYIDVLGSIIGVVWSLASPVSDGDEGGD